jgi:tripartite-type tricarboxylate transporter receptor subunit TctC
LTNLEHAAALPDIPTGKEAGYKSLEFDGLVGLLGPRELPPAAGDRIAADIRAIAAEPEVMSRLASTGQVINPGTPAEFAAALAAQRATVAAIGKVLDIKPAQ